jgi:hypothetical protein
VPFEKTLNFANEVSRVRQPSQFDNLRLAFSGINVPIGDGGNASPLGEEKLITCRYSTL